MKRDSKIPYRTCLRVTQTSIDLLSVSQRTCDVDNGLPSSTRAPARQFRVRRVPDAAIQKPTSCPTPHNKKKMSNKAHNPARKKILWTEQKKGHSTAVLTSRSRNKTDGFPSQMVGRVSCPLPSVAAFDLPVPCVTYCVSACLAMPLCDSRGLASSQTSLQGDLIRRFYFTPAMICMPASLSLVSCT